VPGVVDDGVEVCGLGEDLRGGGVDGPLVVDVRGDRAQVHAVVGGAPGGVGDGLLVASVGVADAGVHGVPHAGERANDQGVEAARRSADEDILGHQITPPLA
jgi:hypothetical protein